MRVFDIVLYLLAILTSLACTVFLFRGFRRTRGRLLFWSALCFVCLTINNVIVFVDLVIFPGPEIDLRPWRLAVSLVGLLCLLFGFIWETE
jgi:hypothetical protein